MNTIVSKTITYGQQQYVLETGEIARQATGAVKVTVGGTVVLVTVVAASKAKAGQDFFPLTVNYQERTYAAGRIPGGYFKREGRPTEVETLTSRLIDRPIRPLFPEGFYNEVQVVATVLSLEPSIQPDIPALIGASAALMIAGVPFKGPIAAARVGYKEGVYLLNPNRLDMETSTLDLVVAGTEHAVLMVESEAQELSEKVMLGAVLFGHTQMQTMINGIKEFAAEAGSTTWAWQPEPNNEMLVSHIKQQAETVLGEAYRIQDKKERLTKVNQLRTEVMEKVAAHYADNPEQTPSDRDVDSIFHGLEKTIVRSRVLNGELRIDGRDQKTVRPITIKHSVLPRVHGSALFTRGETQALVTATLGTQRDSQIIDALEGEYRDKFLLHYNFPPYCVGETGMMSGPKRREIGHGRLARRGIQAVLPNDDNFPYSVRIVSEITESNGSSSMATVCGASIALMDAGVQIKAPVAGIAMGLVKEGDKFAVLTDILGDEDHLGDMDFKVAGTEQGVTALQMDIKIDGITKEIMEVALEQAREGRLHILDIMNGVISKSRKELSAHAPRILTIQIPVGKIAEVIGKGGATIRGITEQTGATVEIADDGIITIAAVEKSAADAAKKRVEDIIVEVEAGQTYTGKITRIVDFGAFVEILPGKEGLLHISQIANERIDKVSDKLSEGQEVTVKVLEVDRQGRMRLSIKALLNEQQSQVRDTTS